MYTYAFLQLWGRPGSQYVRRRQGEEYRSDCIIPTVKFGGGSIMIWGSMSASGVGELFVCEGRMNSQRYISMLEEVLEPSALKLFDGDEPGYYFQQDNAPCHKARAVTSWFTQNNIRVLDWPPQSPDLSPIENLWDFLKGKVSIYKCSSKAVLKQKIFEEWEKIPRDYCQTLVASMPSRIRAVIRAHGGHTKY